MRLAVFTNMYPAQTATFFERDMRALLASGIELDIFAIYPYDASCWQYSLGLLREPGMSHERIHHLGFWQSLLPAARMALRRPGRVLRDVAATLASAARHGPTAFAKTAYVIPKALAWAERHGDRFDHVLGYWGNFAGTCAYVFHRASGTAVPFSLWLHAGVDLYRTPVYLPQKLRYADNVITCCDFNRSYIRERFEQAVTARAGGVHVCHHGLDLADFAYRPEGRPARHVIAVGRLAEHKGFDDLLSAIHLLSSRGWDLTVELVGDGPERHALEALAARLHLSERVRFRGWLPFQGARDAMARATVLVHPSDGLGDGLPNVIREAMALGTPVIASDVAGIPDALGDGCGVLVPPENPAALADGIATLLADDGARARIAASARRRVEERYDVWRNGASLAELLRQSRRQEQARRVAAMTPAPVGSEDA
jgi:glycosyltransferase involved in cell wall biosynthesis